MAVDIDQLQIEIEASSDVAVENIKSLATALTNLKVSAKGGAGLTTVSKQLQTLVSATSGGSSASTKITKLSAALNSLSTVQKPPGLSSTINSLNKLKDLDVSGISTEKMQSLFSALNTLGGVQKAAGLSSTINALNKLPEISKSLETADLKKFAMQMEQVSAAVSPLANEMQKVSNGFAAFPIRIQKIIASNNGLAASNQKAGNSFGFLGTGIKSVHAKFGVYTLAVRRVASVMADWLESSNEYIEDLNLFNVAMGEGAQAAYDYAQEVKNALGIDPAEWMRNQGIFKQITSGFGVVSDKANLMSKNLTQIGYDISSFFNISIEEAMQKVQSGIAGKRQTCPLTKKFVLKQSLKTVKSKLLVAA